MSHGELEIVRNAKFMTFVCEFDLGMMESDDCCGVLPNVVCGTCLINSNPRSSNFGCC